MTYIGSIYGGWSGDIVQLTFTLNIDLFFRISVERERDRTSSPSVHFESVVDLAGPVSDSMAMNKELVSIILL